MLPLWSVYALLSAFFAAIIPIVSKKAFNDLSTLDNTLATTIRAAIMALFLVILSAWGDKFKLASTISTRAYFFIALSGIAGALSWLCYFLAIKLAPTQAIPAVAALDKLSVVFVILLAFIILGDKLTTHTVTGAILLTAGAILISLR